MSSDTKDPSNNGAVLNIAQLIKAVMSSAAKAKPDALYINTREAVPMQNVLKEIGHPQLPTLIQTDNSTALWVVTSNIQPRRTKAMDMRFYWLHDRGAQKQFRFFLAAGQNKPRQLLDQTPLCCSPHSKAKQHSTTTQRGHCTTCINSTQSHYQNGKSSIEMHIYQKT